MPQNEAKGQDAGFGPVDDAGDAARGGVHEHVELVEIRVRQHVRQLGKDGQEVRLEGLQRLGEACW